MPKRVFEDEGALLRFLGKELKGMYVDARALL